MEAQAGKKARPVIVAILEDGSRHGFESQEAFKAFAFERGLPGEAALKLINAQGAPPQPASVEELKRTTERIREDLDALAERAGLQQGSRQVFERAVIERPPDEPPIFDATLIYDQTYFAGATCPVYGDVYDLAVLGGWNGKARSLLTDQSLILWDQRGYSGTPCVVFASGGYAPVADLGWFNGRTVSLQYLR